jgi:hypothetical protein
MRHSRHFNKWVLYDHSLQYLQKDLGSSWEGLVLRVTVYVNKNPLDDFRT